MTTSQYVIARDSVTGSSATAVAPSRQTPRSISESRVQAAEESRPERPPMTEEVSGGQREVTRIEFKRLRVEVFSLVTLGVAIVFLVQLSGVVWASDAYVWPHSVYQGAHGNDYAHQILAFLGPRLVLLGILCATVLLIVKEFSVRRKEITIAVNVLASFAVMSILAVYLLYMVSDLVSNDITREGIVMRLLAN